MNQEYAMDHDALLDALRATCAQMPPVVAMRIALRDFDGTRLHMSAPLAANVNDKGTAFGGSLVALMTLAGWALTTLRLRQAGLEAEVYVADSAVRYRAPLLHDLTAQAWLAPEADWAEFIDTFRRRGKARAPLLAQVLLPDGGVAAELSGRYVALAKG
ncbi:thioesterase domain-containing protein [Pseudoxanthomonas sp. SORGH_AS 997]|uniref:Thioesterase domain-containing protein n=2 Tax=Pseudoxanthomonas TaxID=83618 RepID=A0AAW8GG25_9GAMM|nr:thioesterase domain-containing protein [Pseudoxanthomonas winnipegensis]MDR6139384.1 thioesterase domain-containing protein [Pseudoxanthomonas sp. SORGH_AS_0997]